MVVVTCCKGHFTYLPTGFGYSATFIHDDVTGATLSLNLSENMLWNVTQRCFGNFRLRKKLPQTHQLQELDQCLSSNQIS